MRGDRLDLMIAGCISFPKQPGSEWCKEFRWEDWYADGNIYLPTPMIRKYFVSAQQKVRHAPTSVNRKVTGDCGRAHTISCGDEVQPWQT